MGGLKQRLSRWAVIVDPSRPDELARVLLGGGRTGTQDVMRAANVEGRALKSEGLGAQDRGRPAVPAKAQTGSPWSPQECSR